MGDIAFRHFCHWRHASFFFFSGLFGQVLTSIFPTVYYTQIFADVTAEGQRFQLQSVGKCTLRSKAMMFGLVGGSNSIEHLSGGLLVKKLPSGAGLIIIGPVICGQNQWNKFASDDEIKSVDLQQYLDFNNTNIFRRPSVLLLDDAKNPKQFTGYWREFLTRPNASVQIHSISYKRYNSSSQIAPEKEIPWLKGRKKTDKSQSTQCDNNRPGWVGLYLSAIDKEAWSQREKFNFLRNTNKSIQIKNK